eukprot:CAMPEP_0182573662 /NCGR_PEP_ID=MMETSP1324-20130603/20350_1 /TAXON_ID=236786 /ORGANISM="Florenciella sp., Strain RCC1587" /LENGTH=50 /DNA_ID=CAMNT_0024788805 /DNA_START=107 /DNA_END=256 /DNA_ORIENTATION=+
MRQSPVTGDGSLVIFGHSAGLTQMTAHNAGALGPHTGWTRAPSPPAPPFP